MAEKPWKEELKQALGDIITNDRLKTFREHIRDKQATVFLGMTKSGKSTIVNYLIGTKLVANPKPFNIGWDLIKEDESAPGPVIGTKTISETTVPKIYTAEELPGQIIIDAPGFIDNRGFIQNILNAIYINQIKVCKSVRFVLVSDFNQILLSNTLVFQTLLQKIKKLIPDYSEMADCFSIIFSKVDASFDATKIVGALNHLFLEYEGLVDLNTSLVKRFCGYKELIGVMRKPDGSKLFGSEDRVNIIGAIMNSKQRKVELRFGFSDKSQNKLQKIYTELLETINILSELGKLQQTTGTSSGDSSLSVEKLHEMKMEVEDHQQNFQDEQEIVASMSPFNFKIEQIKCFYKSQGLNFDKLELWVTLDEFGIIKDKDKLSFYAMFRDSLQQSLQFFSLLSGNIEAGIRDRHCQEEMDRMKRQNEDIVMEYHKKVVESNETKEKLVSQNRRYQEEVALMKTEMKQNKNIPMENQQKWVVVERWNHETFNTDNKAENSAIYKIILFFQSLVSNWLMSKFHNIIINIPLIVNINIS